MPEEIVHNADGTMETVPENPIEEIENQGNGEAIEEPKLTYLQSNINRTIEFYNNPSSDRYKDVEKRIKDSGLSMPEYKKEFIETVNIKYGPNAQDIGLYMPDDDHLSTIYDFQNSVWDDFATSFQGGLNRIAFGLGVTIPGIEAAAHKSGEAPEFMVDWIDNMTEWFEETKERTSDESKQSFFDTGSMRAFAGGLGSGAASMAPLLLSFIPYVGKAAYLTTTFADVYGSVLESGREHGLSVENSARMALSLAIPITALEKIGAKGVMDPVTKGARKYFSKGAMNTSISRIMKAESKGKVTREMFKDLIKVTSKDIGRKQAILRRGKNVGKAFLSGAGYEGVTETLQSIVEQTGEVIFDATKEEGTEGHYGTEWGSKKFWLQAVEEGFYGAILGGVMGGGFQAGNGISEQSMYGYVRSSLAKGKPENITEAKAHAKKLSEEGKFTKEEYQNFEETIDEMVKYENLMWHKLDNPDAKYQTYNNMQIKDRAKSVLDSSWLADQEKFNGPQASRIKELANNIQKDAENVINAIVQFDQEVVKKREERDSSIGHKIKSAFVDTKEKYHYNPVIEKLVAPELETNLNQLNSLLPQEHKIPNHFNQQAENEGKRQAMKDGVPLSEEEETNYGGIIRKENFVITQKALENKGEFIGDFQAYGDLAEDENTDELLKIQEFDKLKNKYGMDKDAINYLFVNQNTLFDEDHTYIKQEDSKKGSEPKFKPKDAEDASEEVGEDVEEEVEEEKSPTDIEAKKTDIESRRQQTYKEIEQAAIEQQERIKKGEEAGKISVLFELSEEAYKEPWAQVGKGTNVNTKEEALKEAKEFYDAELVGLKKESDVRKKPTSPEEQKSTPESKSEPLVKIGETLKQAKKRISKEFEDAGGMKGVVDKIGKGLARVKAAVEKKTQAKKAKGIAKPKEDVSPKEDISDSTDEVVYQNLTDMSLDEYVASEKTIRDLASRVAHRIGAEVVYENDSSKEYKGRYDFNRHTAYINLAHATLDTPIHEILGHAIIRAIKTNKSDQTWSVYDLESQAKAEKAGAIFSHKDEDGSGVYMLPDTITPLYKNLLAALDVGKGKEVFDRIKRDYVVKSEAIKMEGDESSNKFTYGGDVYRVNGTYNEETGVTTPYSWSRNSIETITEKEFNDAFALASKKTYYTLEEQQEEAIVELLGMMTAHKLDAIKDKGLISLLKKLLREVKAFVAEIFKERRMNVDKLPDDMTIGDLSDILAYSHSKIILPGYEVTYTTPDNTTFKTYAEANAHITELASGPAVDLDIDKVALGDDIVRNNVIGKIDPISGKKIKTANYIEGTLEEWLPDENQYEPPMPNEYRVTFEDGSSTTYYDEDLHASEWATKEQIDFWFDSNIRQKQYQKLQLEKFLDKNLEYEQTNEAIQEWKKVNNIKYDPNEVYSRGQGFYSALAAYSDFDLDLLLQNTLQHIEDNKKAGTSFVISAYTKPINKTIKHLEGSGVTYKIFPKSEDIKWAANSDVFSGSVWDASAKLPIQRKSEMQGVSYTKAPSKQHMRSKTMAPNLAYIIDNLSHGHNELGIELTGTNFRLEYDDDIPNHTKKLVDSINSILDERFGKVKDVEIKALEKPLDELSSRDKGELGVIEPIQTQENLTESIEDVYARVKKESFIPTGEQTFFVVNHGMDVQIDKNKDGTPITTRKQAEQVVAEQNKVVEAMAKEDAHFIKEFGDDIPYFEVDAIDDVKQKPYDDKARANMHVAALKEVAQKHPRSLIRSEVKEIRTVDDNQSRIAEDDFDDLPFQKVRSISPREQRVNMVNNPFKNAKVRGNPRLYKKIKRHFKRIFPNMPVKEVDNLFNKHGSETLGRLIESGIEINPNKAIQTTLVHEYVHVFLEVLGKNHPLVKEGYELIRGTKFHDEAKELYPDKTEQEQLYEALTEAIAQDSFEKLSAKFEGGNINKFKAWVKRLWRKLKRFIGRAKSSDVNGLLADMLVLQKAPYKIGVSSLRGIDKEQRASIDEDPVQAETINLVNVSLIESKLEALMPTEKEATQPTQESGEEVVAQPIEQITTTEDTKSKTLSFKTFRDLARRYLNEKNNLPIPGVRIFDEMDFSNIFPENKLQGLLPNEADQKIKDFRKAVQYFYPVFYGRINKVIETLTDVALDEHIKEDIDEEQNQDIDQITNAKTIIKPEQKLSPSVLSILNTIVDYDGNQISKDDVQSYLAYAAQSSLTQEEYRKRLVDDSDINIIANRISSVINTIDKGIAQSVVWETFSLMQQEHIALAYATKEELNDEGDVIGREYTTKTRIINEEEKLDDVQETIKSWAANPINIESWEDVFGTYYTKPTQGSVQQIIESGVFDLHTYKAVAEQLESMFKLGINEHNLQDLIDSFKNPNEFMKSINSQWQSIISFAKGENKDGDPIVYGDVKSRIQKVVKAYENKPRYQSSFLNSSNNSVSSTQFGHWISDLTTMLIHKGKKRMNEMLNKDNVIYKNNSVLKYFNKNGIKFAKPDAIKNENFGTIAEYGDLSIKDYHITQMHMFAANTSKDFYKQSIGVISNRDAMMVFNTPTYTQEKLKQEYRKQAETYHAELVKLIRNAKSTVDKNGKEVTVEAVRNKIIDDFNNLYLHQAKINKGNIEVVGGMDVKGAYKDEIAELVNQFDPALKKAYSKEKVGKGKQYSSFEEMVKNYFFTEALNRNYLGDIYGGLSILHTTSPKGAVENYIKRLNGINSNGIKTDFDAPLILVVSDLASDSMGTSGSHLTTMLEKSAGSLPQNKVGLSMKNQIFQIDPDTGEQLYLKLSELGLRRTEGGHNLMNFNNPASDKSGENWKTIGDVILALEDYYSRTQNGRKAYIKLVDKDTMKGTYKHNVVPFSKLLNAMANNGDFSTLESQFSEIEVTNHRTSFNLDKKLGDLDEQVATFSTQAMLQQFNSIRVDVKREDYIVKGDIFETDEEASDKAYAQAVLEERRNRINQFEAFAVAYLNKKMNNYNGDRTGHYADSLVYEQMIDYDYVIKEMGKEMVERDKTLSGKIFNEILKYNEKSSGTKISSVDHPNVRGIYEQYVASQFSKKGIKIDMAGNFMHQIPTYDSDSKNTLKHREVAVPWKMFANSREEANELLALAKKNGTKLQVVVVRIPASAEMSMFAGEVKYFLDTDSNVVALSDKFVDVSDSDHDGDKAMVYRKHISKDGNVSDVHIQSRMFEKLFNNLNTPEFVAKSENETLSLKEIEDAVEGRKIKVKDYVARTIDDIANIAQKLGLGTTATGNFSIASKMMSLLSQEGEGLINPLLYEGTNGKKYNLQKFTTKQVTPLAKLLQAALDMANKPILASTGFNNITINVGSAMLLLGVDVNEVINYLSSKPIEKMVNDFLNDKYVFGPKPPSDFNSFFESYSLDNKELKDFARFKEVSDGIAKMISYVQLDKTLPGNSQEVDQLLEDVLSKEEEVIPFTIDKLKSRTLNKHRLKILQLLKRVLDSTSLIAVQQIKNRINGMSNSMTSPYEFKRNVNNQLVQYFSQFQLSKKRENPKEFIYDFADKIKTIVDTIRTGSVEIDDKAHGLIANVYTEMMMAPSQESRNYAWENFLEKERVLISDAKKRGIDINDLVRDYHNKMTDVQKNRVFEKNAFINSIRFRAKDKFNPEDGYLMSLDGSFKETKGSRTKMEKAFKEIQDINPELAKEFIDYQLYRHGLNDKIGSFIDALPMDVHTKMLLKATRFRQDFIENENLSDEIKELKSNMLGANKSNLKIAKNIKKITDNQLYMTLSKKSNKYLNHDGVIYERMDGQETKNNPMYKIYEDVGNFQMDENFTAFNVDMALEKKSEQKEIDRIRKACKT